MTTCGAILAITILVQAPSPALSPAERASYQRVSEATIREITTALSAPAMEGRGTGQPGGQRAADYLAGWMRRIGLAPLGDSGTYLQHIAFLSSTVLPASTLTGEARLAYPADFLVVGPAKDGATEVSGPLAFVGYGVGLGNADLHGKIVVVVQGTPTAADSTWAQAVNPRGIVRSLVTAGAAAVLILPDPAGPSFALYTHYMTRRGVR
ncbi:MAG: hypothetical protein ACREKB_12215, partial [Candidatus Rokuibacteriota bacterium]